MKEKQKELAKEILEGVNQGLRSSFARIREQHFNPNTKGYEYEKIVADFFKEYLGSHLDFYVRAYLLDKDLAALDLISTQANEFDVVATYSRSIPKIVQRIGDFYYVPYDAVAIVFEVKQQLTSQTLKADLRKLIDLSKLRVNEKRFGGMLQRQYSITRPLRSLVYFSSEIDENTMGMILAENLKAWDMILLVDEDRLILSPELPASSSVLSGFDKNKGRPVTVELDESSLLQMVLGISMSLSYPSTVSTLPVFYELLKSQND